MENQELTLNIPQDYKGDPITIINREGQAPEIPVNKKVAIIGIITSPGEYINKNYAPRAEFTPPEIEKGIITFSRNPRKLFIKFDEFPAHPIDGAIITGNMRVNPDLEEFQINQNTFWTAKQAIELIRRQARNFDSLETARGFIKKLQNFEATFEQTRKTADDRKGNIEDAVKETIKIKEGEMPPSISLVIPLYHLGRAMTVKMEVEIQRKGTEVVYGFYCLELETQMRDEAKFIIETNTSPFNNLFVIIEQE